MMVFNDGINVAISANDSIFQYHQFFDMWWKADMAL